MRREKNVILSLSINGRTVSKPLEMKEEVAMLYKSLCSHEKRIRPSCSNLLFKKLSPQYVAALEIPFSFEEVNIRECDGDKAPAPDGINFFFLLRKRGIQSVKTFTAWC